MSSASGKKPSPEPHPGPLPSREKPSPHPHPGPLPRERESFVSFGEFYPYYLSEHRNATCRRLHFAGTTLVLALLAAAIVLESWWPLLLVPVAGYGFAWLGHFGFEKNRPATFRHPLYSLAGDWVMYWQLIRGKIPFEERNPGTRQGADRA